MTTSVCILSDVRRGNFNEEVSWFDIPQVNTDSNMTVTEMTNIFHNCAIVSMSVTVIPTVNMHNE